MHPRSTRLLLSARTCLSSSGPAKNSTPRICTPGWQLFCLFSMVGLTAPRSRAHLKPPTGDIHQDRRFFRRPYPEPFGGLTTKVVSRLSIDPIQGVFVFYSAQTSRNG